jgi:CubicO group peptidase (beta-lactamase class C family)
MRHALTFAALALGVACATPARRQAMAFPGAAWAEDTPESQGIGSAGLQDALNYLAANVGSNGLTETVVVRNGILVWKGTNIDRQHSTWSCSKSFTSTAFGLLLQDGRCALDTPARDHVPELAAQYGGVTLRHFATMTSGYDGEGGSYDAYEGRSDANALVPPLSPLFAPGTEFRYWDEAMMQFGNALTRIAGEPLGDLLKRRVLDPIGLRTWTWLQAGSVPNWTGGFSTTARELARFGHLFLNRGNWNGTQLVAASWVDQATSVQVPSTMPYDPLPRSEGAGVYGYNWWVNGLRADGTREWPGAPPRTFAAWGFNNNMCFVVPEWSMVVVRMGTDGNVNRSVWSEFFSRLGSALGAAPPPPPPAQSVTRFALVDADTDQPIFDPLNGDATLNLGTLPTRNLNVRAETSPAAVGSVRFGLDGNPNYRTENGAPYALAGDASGDYNPWTPAIGPHSVIATPYTLSGAGGTAGTPLSISFTVIDDPSTPSSNGPPSAPPPPPSGGAPPSDDGGGGNCGATGLEALLACALALARPRRPAPRVA